MTVLWWIWAPIGWTLGFFWMSLVVLIGAPTTLFIVPFTTWYVVIKPLMTQAFIWSTLSKPTITYDVKFDPERRAVFVQNHVSALDAMVACTVIPHCFCGLENAAHYNIPVYGWIIRLANGIKVPSAREKRFDAILEAALERRELGMSILAFPEGHRTTTGHTREFRTGAFRMAQAMGYPVVPIASKGLFHILPKGTGILRRGPVSFHVGPAFETEGLSEEGLKQLAAEVRSWIDKRA